ncbi:MAG: dihydrodipicolinate reductase [Candidatus Binatia bacterium]
MRKYRVIQWSTGWVGRLALHSIVRREDMELVGLWVHSESKEGEDAGTLAGGAPVGVKATRDVDALLALDADCVCYTAHGETRLKQCIKDVCRILEAGKNVVTTSLVGPIYGPGMDPKARAPLEAACRAGGTSLFASGVEPGFFGDFLPLVLATMSEQVRSVRTQEIFGYEKTPTAATIFDFFGFGRPQSYRPIIMIPGVQRAAWGPAVQMVAGGLGVTLDEIRETFETEVTPRRLEVAAGVIEAGTVGAVRFATIGIVKGEPVVVIEHVNRMSREIAPHWPSAEREGTYRLIIQGNPNMTCEFHFGESDERSSDDGMTATAMRVVNAIPYVCAAPPGLVSALDLPLTLPKHAVYR